MNSLYSEKDYRSIIKDRLKLAKQDKKLRLVDFSSQLGIQYTYLSKCLNQMGHHLSNDHVYQIVKSLGFNDDEIDYILLLK